jgi:hypothetical protein
MIVAEQYTINQPAYLDTTGTATEATLRYAAGRWTLEHTWYDHRVPLTEDQAIDWMTISLQSDPNQEVAYDGSLRTVVRDLPPGTRLAEVIADIDIDAQDCPYGPNDWVEMYCG